MTDHLVIYFRKKYKKLPHGYKVVFYVPNEHYLAFTPKGNDSPIFDCRFEARKWCFEHFKEMRNR